MKRILLITSVLPWPLRRNGGAQRSALVKKALETHGHVDVFAVGGPELKENVPEFAKKLADQHVVRCIVRKPVELKPPFYMPGKLVNLWKTIRGYESHYEPDHDAAYELEQVLKTHHYDLIVCRYLQPGLQSAIKRHHNIPKLLDFDDIDWSTFQINLAAKPWPGIGGKIGAQQVLKRIRVACDGSMNLFRTVFVTSEEDQKLLTNDTFVLPNIPFSDNADVTLDAQPAARDSRELLFVGDLQFPPNRDGLDRFLTNIWPKIRQSVPGAVLSVVGRGLAEDRAAKWREIPGVNVIGFAPDLLDCYRRCAFTVVPIYFGGGTKIKVLESLAYGRTVVTTPQAMRGYTSLAEPEPSVAVTDDDAEFAAACIRLLQTPDLRDAMAARGRMIVSERFSFAKFREVIDIAMNEVFGAEVFRT